MDLTALLPYVVPVILTVLAHRWGYVDLGTSGGKVTPPAPLDPKALPPAVVPLPKHPAIEMLEREVEAAALALIRSRLSGVVHADAPPAAPAK